METQRSFFDSIRRRNGQNVFLPRATQSLWTSQDLREGSKAVLEEAMVKQDGKEDGSAATLNVVHTSSDGATDEASLDIFYPLKKPERSNTSEGAERYPVVIYIHGGYWQALDKKSSCWHAKTFTRKWNRICCIGYDLCPSISFKDLMFKSTTESLKWCSSFLIIQYIYVVILLVATWLLWHYVLIGKKTLH